MLYGSHWLSMWKIPYLTLCVKIKTNLGYKAIHRLVRRKSEHKSFYFGLRGIYMRKSWAAHKELVYYKLLLYSSRSMWWINPVGGDDLNIYHCENNRRQWDPC